MPQWAKARWIQDIWHAISPRLPQIGVALAILVLGWLAAAIVSRSLFAALKKTTLDDRIARGLGFETGGERGARVERVISKTLYYLLLLFVAIAFFSYLGISAVTAPLVTVLDGVAGAIPNLLKATVIGFGGFLLATGVRKLIVSVLDKLDFDGRMQRLGGEDIAPEPPREQEDRKKKKRKKDKSGTTLSRTIGEVAYWFVLVVAAIPVLEALKIGVLAGPLSTALSTVTTYLPKIAAASVLLVVGYVLARMARGVVSGVLARVGVDRAVARLGFGRITREHSLSGILGALVMAFILLHFAISAVGRLEIAEISAPLSSMLERIYVYLPKLLVGGLLMSIGVVVARIAGSVAAHLLAAMGFNTLMVHIGLFKQVSPEAKQQEQSSRVLVKERLHASGSGTADPGGEAGETVETDELLARTGAGGLDTPADIAGVIVAAVIVLLFLRQVLGTMGLEGLGRLLDGLLAYLPNVLVAVVLMGAGLWAGRWSQARIDELTRNSNDRLLKAMGNVAHVAVVAFTVMMALQQLGVGRQLIAIAFALILGAVCLAGALAFGLGGREVAGRILSEEYTRRKRGAPRAE